MLTPDASWDDDPLDVDKITEQVTKARDTINTNFIAYFRFLV